MEIDDNTVGKSQNGNLPVILYYVFKIIPALVAAGSIYLGYHLFVLGVTGQASLSVHSETVGGQLLNAAPGLFFALGGIAALMMSIAKGVDVRMTKKSNRLSTGEKIIEDISHRMRPAGMSPDEESG